MPSSIHNDKQELSRSQKEVFSKECPCLLLHHYQQLHDDSGLSVDVIKERGYESVLGKKRLAEQGFTKAQQRVPGLLCSGWGVDGQQIAPQFKPDHPRVDRRGRPIKYETPKGAANRIDCPPRCRKQLADPSVPLYICEGKKKADCLGTQGLCTVDIPGIWSWKSKNQFGGITIASDFDNLAFNSRQIYLVPDSDIATIPGVRQACLRLAEHLKRKKGKLSIVYLPQEGTEKVGVDDFLVGGHSVDELLALAVPLEEVPPEEGGKRKANEYIIYDNSGNAKLDLPTLTTDLMNDFKFLTLRDTDEVLTYHDGLWQFGGEKFIAWECQRRVGVDALLTLHKVGEIIGYIRRSTYTDRGVLNREKWLINLKNGLLDVRTKELKPHRAEVASTIRIPVTYDPNADCPRIKQFFAEVLEPEDVPTIHELAGYALIPDYSIQRAFLFIGDGSNGKSTLLSLLRTFLGKDNCSSVPWCALEYSRFASSRLDGRLLNIYADLPSRSMDSTGGFKMLTGGDAINAERKFKDGYSFINFARLVFSANKPPRILDEDSYAFWRRWIIINLPNQFPENDPKTDPEILSKLTTESELSGLLNLALDGLQRLLANSKFSYGKTVDQTQSYYLRASDPIYAFVEDCCELDSDAVTSKDALFEAFKNYCKENKTPLINRDSFAKSLKNSPHFKVTLTRPMVDGERVHSWRGIKVVQPVQPLDPFKGRARGVGEVNKDVDKVNKSKRKRADTSDRLDRKGDIWDGMPDYPTKPCSTCGGTDFWPDFRGKRFVCSRCHPEPGGAK